MPQIALARTTCAGGLTHHHNAGGREGITWKHPEAPHIGLTRLGGKARARSTSVQLTPFTSCRDLEASADTRIQDRFGQAQTVFVCNDCTAIVIAILETPSPWPWPPRPAAVHLEVVSAMSRSGRGKLLENKENKGIGGAAQCAVRAVQDASAGRIRPSWRHTYRRCSATHNASHAVTEDRKHVEASAASRSEASTAVAASAYLRGLVCDQAISCAP